MNKKLNIIVIVLSIVSFCCTPVHILELDPTRKSTPIEPFVISYFISDSLSEKSLNDLRKIDSTIAIPGIRKYEHPQYPDLARQYGAQGNVIVRSFVDEFGNTNKVIIQQTDQEIFTNPSVDALIQWKYVPLKINGKKVPFIAVIPIIYEITNGKGVVKVAE